MVLATKENHTMNHEELIVQAHTPQTRDSGLP